MNAAFSDDELTEQVRGLPKLVELWRLFHAHCEMLCNRINATLYCFALDICLKTWQQEQILRVHGHLFAKKADGRMRCTKGPVINFQGVQPHITKFVFSRCSRGWAGAYYVAAPRVGSLYTAGSLGRNADFPVNPSWIFSMVE